MAVIFSDNFNTGTTGWTLNPSNTGFLEAGCGGTLCLSCGNNFALGPRKIFPALQLHNTFRFNFAYLVNGPTPDVGYLLKLQDYNGTHHLLDFLVYPDGKIQIASAESRFSSVGLIPTNGTWIAVQITANMYTAVHGTNPAWINNVGDFQVIVNNVVVWNLIKVVLSANNYSSDPLPTGWTGCELLGYAITGGGGVLSALVAYDNFEVEDVVTVTTYNVCTPLPTNLYVDICTNPPEPPPPDMSGVYMMTPSDATHDNYYGSVAKKIPNPIIRTAIIGE